MFDCVNRRCSRSLPTSTYYGVTRNPKYTLAQYASSARQYLDDAILGWQSMRRTAFATRTSYMVPCACFEIGQIFWSR